MREELVSRNVAKLIQVETPNYRVNRGLSTEQARTLLKETKADRLYGFYVLAIYLGMRRGELLGLRWQDVDLAEKTLEITNTLQRVDGKLRLVPPKSRTSERTVPLPQVCVDALTIQRDQQARDVTCLTMVCGRRLTTSSPPSLARSWSRTTCAGAGTR